jgi:hypothetical protein
MVTVNKYGLNVQKVGILSFWAVFACFGLEMLYFRAVKKVKFVLVPFLGLWEDCTIL